MAAVVFAAISLGGPVDLCEVILPASELLKVVCSICCERNLKQVCGSLDHAFSQL